MASLKLEAAAPCCVLSTGLRLASRSPACRGHSVHRPESHWRACRKVTTQLRGWKKLHSMHTAPGRAGQQSHLMPSSSLQAQQNSQLNKWRRWERAVWLPAAAFLLTTVWARPVQAISWSQALVGPVFDPLLKNEPYWLRSLVWNDFRLALIFFVTAPLVLWVWSLRVQTGRDDAIKRIMFGYWQAASLLMWTVYLQIGSQPLGFFTALAVQVLAPASLWWWKDLNQEVSQGSSRLKSVFVPWRLVTTVLAAIGFVTQLTQTQLPCTLAGSPEALAGKPTCAAWLEPPLNFARILHPGIAPETLQVVGFLGASIFAAYLTFYIFIIIPRTGRVARSNESLSYKVLASLGFYKS
ncbi:hypothetical protein WJX74_005342 [Apatococcus lobatus]|uniref:Uncharacterized protein n=2 Tax=Apatococcus TaxID=904362 RepID=A0AAW1T2E3_9CHLO